MDIYAQKGTKVIFLNANGREIERELAASILTPEGIYTVESTEVFGWSSYVELHEYPGHKFNTVMFLDVELYEKNGVPPQGYITVPRQEFTEPKKRKTRVYLGGSVNAHIQAADYEGWRNLATSLLEGKGYEILNPVRGRIFGEKYEPGEVTERDLKDIWMSDVLLVEMTHERMPYIGTSMEVYQARMWDKGVIVWGTANENSYWMRRYAPERHTQLRQAIDALVDKYGPETEDIGLEDEDLPF